MAPGLHYAERRWQGRRHRPPDTVFDIRRRVARGETLETAFATATRAGGGYATAFLLALEACEGCETG
jgi:hypothetical protein